MRPEITPELIAQAERLLAEGHPQDQIAKELGITAYVVGLIAEQLGKSSSKKPSCSRKPPRQRPCQPRPAGLDAATIRLIQRMLALNWYHNSEIGLAARVSHDIVGAVKAGRRKAVNQARPVLSEGERFIPETIRCPTCGYRVEILPCRICAATREKSLTSRHQRR